MAESREEIEVKLAFPSPDEARTRILSLGARAVQPRHFEDNVLYDRAERPLAAERSMLRLRRAGSGALLTYKTPSGHDPRYKVRQEHETRVEDAEVLARILDRLGFLAIYRYQKYRTVYRTDDVEISLDETPLGCFVELEGTRAGIDAIARSLGFGVEQYVRESYRELHERQVRTGQLPPGDLLLPQRSKPV